MKKAITILLIMLVSFAFSGYTQNTTDLTPEPGKIYNNFITCSTFHFFENTFMLNYERIIKGKQGLMLSAGYRYTSGNPNNSDVKDEGFNAEIQYRFYLSMIRGKNDKGKIFGTYAFSGVYAAPFFGFRYTDRSSQEYYPYYLNGMYDPNYYNRKDFFTGYSEGVIIGYQFAAKSRIAFDMYFGGGMKESYHVGGSDIPNYNTNNNTFLSPIYSGVMVKAGFQIGVIF